MAFDTAWKEPAQIIRYNLRTLAATIRSHLKELEKITIRTQETLNPLIGGQGIPGFHGVIAQNLVPLNKALRGAEIELAEAARLSMDTAEGLENAWNWDIRRKDTWPETAGRKA